MKERLKTGYSDLDKPLGGGFPPGAIVTFVSESRMQGELFLHELMEGEDTVYVSTIGNEETVQAEFAKSPMDLGEDVNVVYASPDAPVQGAMEHIKRLNDTRLTIIDTVSDLERTDALNVERGPYQEFLNWVQNLQRRTGGIVILHRYKTDSKPEKKHVTDSMSDIIIELEEVMDADQIVNYLHMPKCRGGSVLTQRIKVKLSGGMKVDTSRDIA